MRKRQGVFAAVLAIPALVFAGCATAPQAADAPPAPYVWTGPFCGEGGCETYPMRVKVIGEQGVPIVDRPALDAREIARAPMGANLVLTERRMVLRHLRGVVTEAGGGLKAGDVVYRRYGPRESLPGDPPAGTQDEPSSLYPVLHRGKRVFIDSDAPLPGIAWEEDPVRSGGNGIDDWRRIAPSDGRPEGWILELGFFCWADYEAC